LYAIIFRVDEGLRLLAARIRAARRVAVMTGAGVSAASGIPTFRGPGGLWRTYRPEDLATPEAFAHDPALVWQWYAWRRETIASCTPNAAHEVLARWSQQRDERGVAPAVAHVPVVRVITQNVDDLHVRAGTNDLVRLHGSLWELKCFDECRRGAAPWRDERVPLPDAVPRCPHCGGYARPAVVWFGESLERADLERAAEATACDVFLTVGTSAVVYPAASLVHQAQSRGAFTAEINLEETSASSLVNLSILGAAEQVLPSLDQLLAPG
jgi:NAD-dependent deacetylase